jgi:hypothetical protein
MKRCPTCNKTFTDPNLSYCIDDGTPLAPVPGEDDESTRVGSHSSSAQTPPAYQPPSYTAPVERSKRRTWPWVVGIFGVLFLVLIGVSVAAVLLIPRMVRREPVIVSRANDNNAGNANTHANNTNSESHDAGTNSNSGPTGNTPPPTDKDLVMTQLTNLEQEWTVANINADKKKLQEILADDYVGPDGTGKMQGKAEYINNIQRDTSIQKWDFDDLHLVQRGDRATLTGKIHYQIEDKEVVYDFVDRFVWRDGRWQATGSDVTPNQ